MMSEDSSKAAAVQLRVPDTNTPASPNTQQQQQQQQRSINGSNFPSDYSLFELETFFTRWAPDNDSASPTAGPSCPFPADNPAESDQDGVIIVESKPSVSSAVSLSAGGSSVHIQPSVPQGTSASTHLRTPTRSSQRPWSRTTAAIRLGQVPSAQSTMSSNVAAVTLTKSQDKRSVSRTMSSTAAPQAALSVRGSATVLAGIEAAIAAQHRASFLARRNKYPIASTVPVDRRRKSYVCRACGKAFSGLSNLEAHERVHTGEKPFRCNTCGKHFSEAGNLKKHQRVHTGEKPFSCDQCGKRFAWICNLRTHQQSATGCGAQGRAGLGLGPSSHTVNCGGHDADAGCISHT